MTTKQKVWTSLFLGFSALLAFFSAYFFIQDTWGGFYVILYNSGALLLIAFMAAFPTNEVERPFIIKKIPSTILIFAGVNLALMFVYLSYAIGLWIPLTICGLASIYFSVLIRIVWLKSIE